MTSVELDPRFMRTFRSTWEDTPSSHAVPHSMLTALGLTRGDYLDVKAWIFLVARKLQFENGERAAFKVSFVGSLVLHRLPLMPSCRRVRRLQRSSRTKDPSPWFKMH